MSFIAALGIINRGDRNKIYRGIYASKCIVIFVNLRLLLS